MVKMTMISDDIDEETGKRKKVKLKVSFWSVLKMYLIGWFITTGLIVGITLLINRFIGNILP